jgi:hypothetical protein
MLADEQADKQLQMEYSTDPAKFFADRVSSYVHEGYLAIRNSGSEY